MNRYYFGALLWSCLILGLTLTPSKSMPSVSLFDYDKLGHIIIFLVLNLLFTAGLFKNNYSLKKSIYLGLVITLLYGIAIEVAQRFIPDRGMELGDLLANSLGTILGLFGFLLIKNRI